MKTIEIQDYYLAFFKTFDIDFKDKMLISESFCKHKISQLSLEEIVKLSLKAHVAFKTKYLPEMEQNLNHLLFHFQELQPKQQVLKVFFQAYKKVLLQYLNCKEQHFFKGILNRIENVNYNLHQIQVSTFDYESAFDCHSTARSQLGQIFNLIQTQSKAFQNVLPSRLFINQMKAMEMNLNIDAWLESKIIKPKLSKLETKIKQRQGILLHNN